MDRLSTNRPTRIHFVLLAAALFFPGAAPTGRAAEPESPPPPPPVRFNRDVRPILAENCLKCHGRDASSREADLRLDTPAGSRADLGDTHAVVPGKPAESELVRRIGSEDPDERMPPAESGKVLSPEQRQILIQWIREGASYQSHWSFRPIEKVAVPSIEAVAWPRNPIDHFVLARLEQEGLQPAPAARRPRLIRRLSFDLTGLPPTLDQIDAFLADQAAGAYERLVDRLIGSPHFGERMAADWLDLARYADTYGYQADVTRAVWPWRDWVVRAFNENLPYDDFVTWQVAGDLLPDASREQRLATAFNRLHRQTNEGGSIEEEFRVAYVADRTETFGTAFLGLTIKCARCHDHKYDPISQKDYYRLFAFFNNIDESGLYSHFTDAVPTPTLWLTGPEQERQLAELEQQIDQAEQLLVRLREDRRPAFRQWLARGPVDETVAGLVGDYGLDAITDGRVANRTNADKPARADDDPQLVAGRRGRAVQLSGDNRIVLEGVGAFTRADPFSIALWLQTPDEKERAVVFHRSRSWTDAGSRGYQLLIEAGRLSGSLIHFWPGNAMRIRTEQKIPLQQWLHVALTYNGSSSARGLRLYLDGRLATVETVRDHLVKNITGGGPIELTIGERFRDRGFKDGLVDEFQVYNRCLTALEVANLHAGIPLEETLTAAAGEQLFDYYLAVHDEPYRDATDRLGALRRRYFKTADAVTEIMTMEEMPEPRATYLLRRGAYDAPGEQVFPDTPKGAFPLAGNLPRNRLGLARWLTDPRHPLTARVAVNRLWQLAFGTGLVATAEDFGSQGEPPSHPELLDWLARTLIELDWNVKALVKLIVTSSTYRQSSTATAAQRAADPANRLLARGPSHRLPAEMIRDAALATSGLLVDRLGGPPAKPYQPAGLWQEKSGKPYVPDEGEGLYRRSLYTFWKRTSPPPAMISFDAAKRDVCVARRQTTNTPMQALVLLNDPQYVEAARVLAERVSAPPGDSVRTRLGRTFRILTGRRPSDAERQVLQALYDEQLELFQQHPERAEQLLAVGRNGRDTGLSATELAATTMVASTLLGLDETITKR